MNEMPQITGTSYQQALSTAGLALAQQYAGAVPQLPQQWVSGGFRPLDQPQQTTTVEPSKMAFSCRLVKVFIADADENVPLDKRLLYSGDEKLTDLTDQELFFEVPLTDLLAKHNDFRKTLEDKKANKDKPVMLEPIRVRDLKMLVVALANF